MHKNENKSGYKKTKIGWIPDSWNILPLGEITDADSPIRYGVVQIGIDTEGGVPIVPIKHINRITSSPLHRASTEIEARYVGSRIKGGDILLSVKATIGVVGVVPKGFIGNIAREIARIRLYNKYDSCFVAMQLKADATQRRICKLTVGSTRHEFSIHAVRMFSLALPPLPEQKAIAGVLECWDKTIRGVERKIEKKREIKKGLMQQLLTGTRRLPEFGAAKGAQGRRVEGKNSEGWRGERLGVIAAIRKGRQLNRLDQAETGEYPVLNGGVQPFGYADKWNTAANTICVSEGGNSCGFVSLITTRFWCGGHCYALKEDASQVDKSFLHQQLKFRQAAIMRLRVGSGLPNIQKKALEKFHLKVPRIEEQRAIAAILSSADEEIAGLERKLANLKEQRRFLLNNLVTGAIRLPRFAKRRQGAVKGVRK